MPMLKMGAKGGYQAAKFLAPYLLPAGGFVSSAMTLAEPFLKDANVRTYQDDAQNKFMYQQCLKDFGWTTAPTDPSNYALWLTTKQNLETL